MKMFPCCFRKHTVPRRNFDLTCNVNNNNTLFQVNHFTDMPLQPLCGTVCILYINNWSGIYTFRYIYRNQRKISPNNVTGRYGAVY